MQRTQLGRTSSMHMTPAGLVCSSQTLQCSGLQAGMQVTFRSVWFPKPSMPRHTLQHSSVAAPGAEPSSGHSLAKPIIQMWTKIRSEALPECLCNACCHGVLKGLDQSIVPGAAVHAICGGDRVGDSIIFVHVTIPGYSKAIIPWQPVVSWHKIKLIAA